MSIPLASAGASDQSAYWNGAGANRWSEGCNAPDAVFAPIAELLYARARPAPGERVVDVGCGCGATAVELARRVGPTGRAVGVDISAAMIAEARRRAPAGGAAEFLVADAATHVFAPASIDLLFSRFGVMFFADPALAFANLRKATKRGGRLVFACWRELARNPWHTVPLEAACKHVPRPREPGPDEPGPFSLADEARLRRVLAAAGFVRVAPTPVEFDLDLAAGKGFDAAVETPFHIGFASRALENQPEASRAAARGAIRAALAPYRRGASVPLRAAIWIVEAVNP
jgi:SAM-dependent methyltransferase